MSGDQIGACVLFGVGSLLIVLGKVFDKKVPSGGVVVLGGFLIICGLFLIDNN
jgi:hypothetical protein